MGCLAKPCYGRVLGCAEGHSGGPVQDGQGLLGMTSPGSTGFLAFGLPVSAGPEAFEILQQRPALKSRFLSLLVLMVKKSASLLVMQDHHPVSVSFPKVADLKVSWVCAC